jgi:hypothetical protein
VCIGLLPDYSNQARTYDTTRGASPSVLAPLRDALTGAPGRTLLDIGGGTGNYAQALVAEGWQPLVLELRTGRAPRESGGASMVAWAKD